MYIRFSSVGTRQTNFISLLRQCTVMLETIHRTWDGKSPSSDSRPYYERNADALEILLGFRMLRHYNHKKDTATYSTMDIHVHVHVLADSVSVQLALSYAVHTISRIKLGASVFSFYFQYNQTEEFRP